MQQSYYPSFYSPTQVGQLYSPNFAGVSEEALQAGWSPASTDSVSNRVALQITDNQIDFCHDDGNLSVPGALDDTKRLIDLIYREGQNITSIVLTIDTHYPIMIFFPPWWRAGKDFQDQLTGVDYKKGDCPNPFTVITEESISRGEWQAVVMQGWSHTYPSLLAQSGKNPLMIWPFHCLDGTPGINLLPPLYEAIMYWSIARYTEPTFVHKGQIPQTEFYSPMCPEVIVPNVAGGGVNKEIMNMLANHSHILKAGQAKSHCVLADMETNIDYFSNGQDADVLQRILFLEDCTSSVQHPDIDFDGIASQKLDDMRKQHGVQLVKSSEISL